MEHCFWRNVRKTMNGHLGNNRKLSRAAVSQLLYFVFRPACAILAVCGVALFVSGIALHYSNGAVLMDMGRETGSGLDRTVYRFKLTRHYGGLDFELVWSNYRFVDLESAAQATSRHLPLLVASPLDEGAIIRQTGFRRGSGFGQAQTLHIAGSYPTGISVYFASGNWKWDWPKLWATDTHHEIGLALTANVLLGIGGVLLVPFAAACFNNYRRARNKRGFTVLTGRKAEIPSATILPKPANS